MLHSNASKILSDFHCEHKKNDDSEEKIRVIKAAAALILSDIKSLVIDTEWYPDPNTLGEVHKQTDCLPNSLMFFSEINNKREKQRIKSS